ncbi:MAG: M23 family metallopeptidase [Bacilli bacterium]|nr:M23 family metallopeptidase [Bacilli bacterium]
MDCRVLKKRKCIITQDYTNSHAAIDMVGDNYTLDDIIAHSDGIIDIIQDGYGNMKGSSGTLSYGNYIKINHQNGYYTLYAHLKNGLNLKKNQKINKGQIIGYMSDSGNAYGKHLHFEVWKENKRINPTEYLNKDLPFEEIKQQYQIGDIVTINGVYVSSKSQEKLRPLITEGEITKIIENVRNPYLLENGKIGWVNNDVIISKKEYKYLSNENYKGNSIVDALNEININSSYQYRKKLAKINDINNYQGTADQNLYLLNLLKQGKLKYE